MECADHLQGTCRYGNHLGDVRADFLGLINFHYPENLKTFNTVEPSGSENPWVLRNPGSKGYQKPWGLTTL